MQGIDNQRRIYSISELTIEIKTFLENKYPFLWLYGEVSNFRRPGSGHLYFTLKDENAQINAVMFRTQADHLKFRPEDGMSLTGLGRISVYEPRGTYQVILEYLEPRGIGALQIAFEQLKRKLSAEGLFDAKYKKPLPFLPKKICVITSPTGAAIRDILHVIERRFNNVHIDIIPVRVQGGGAEEEIAAAVDFLGKIPDADVAILARGGGSIEDLQAFNAEIVARAVFNADIPIISAVGHETDYSISDFVADLRAPTPSAAAEIVVPVKADLNRRCDELEKQLCQRINTIIMSLRRKIDEKRRRLVHPKRKIQDLRLRIDDLTQRLNRMTQNRWLRNRERLQWRSDKLFTRNPYRWIRRLSEKVKDKHRQSILMIGIRINQKRAEWEKLHERLEALNPASILERGFSITRRIPDGSIIKDPNSVRPGQKIETIVAKGKIISRVEEKTNNDSENPNL